MDTSGIEKVAEKVLNEEGCFEIGELIREGKVELARINLLFIIDSCYDQGGVTFDEAAGLYQLLCVSPERASAFRQENYQDNVE